MKNKLYDSKFKILLYILLAVFFTECTNHKKNFSVSGFVEAGHGKEISLSLLTTEKKVTTDSIKINEDNTFELNGYTEFPAFFTLNLNEEKIIYLVAAPKNKIEIKTNAKNFESEYIVKGSYDSQLIRDMVLSQQKTTRKLNELAEIYKDSLNHPDAEKIIKRRNAKRKEYIEDQRTITLGLINENPTSMASLMALYQHLDPYTPILDPKTDFEVFELVDSNLISLYPQSEAVHALNKYIVKNRIKAQSLGINEKAPEISLPNPQGETLQLASFRGKYVLVQFWASWSKESRAENKYLVQAYKNYKNQPFEIFQVSLDKDSASWNQAINEDQLNWSNVSDLKFWNSVAARMYNVKQLPFNFLLDPEGVVIRTDLRGNEIANTLQEIFN